MNRFHFYTLILSIAIISSISNAAEEKKGPRPASAVAPAGRTPAGLPAGVAPRRPNFSVIFGSITKIDNTDPAKPKLEVKSDIDGASHVVELTPWTNVTKVTDASELKTGDTVRITARKVEASEVAMTVVFGKIRNIYAPKPTRPITGGKK